MKVTEIMTQQVVVTSEDSTLEETAKIMQDHRVGGVPVVNAEGRIVGIVTDSDFAAKEKGIPFGFMKAPQVLGEWMEKEDVARIYEKARNKQVKEIMSAPAVTVNEDAEMEEVISRMLEHDINRIPVVTDGKPVGIVSRHDLLRIMVRPPQAQP